MNTKSFLLNLSLSLLLAVGLTTTITAQRRGNGQGRQGAGNTGSACGGQGGQFGRNTTDRSGSGWPSQQLNRKQQRLQLSSAQQNRLRTCDQAMKKIRTQARDLSRSAGKQGLSARTTGSYRNQLKQSTQLMNREHTRLMTANKNADPALQNQLKNLEQSRQRLQTRLDRLDQELNRSPVDAARIRDRARAVEQAATDWQKKVRRLSDDSATDN